ncbi:hypothetical protein GT23_2884 [Parageobacillus thermoglucosidasius]|nr:hypothetical protein GT23_2884 [Parageobacillus thermoglucosidasius]
MFVLLLLFPFFTFITNVAVNYNKKALHSGKRQEGDNLRS